MQSTFVAPGGAFDGSPFNFSPVGNGTSSHSKQVKVESSEEAIEEWLKQFGFHFNPFRDTDAERDEHLSNYFIEHPHFNDLAQLENRLIFARAGDGKTVLRLRLQSLYREELPRQKVFCFSYTIPLTVAENPPSDILPHLPHILKASVRHAFVLLATHGNDLANLENNSALASEFAAYFDRYLGTTLWLDDLHEALAANSINPIVENLKPTFDDLDLPSGWLTVNRLWLRRWIDLLRNATEQPPLAQGGLARWQAWQGLLRQAGFQASLMLVDGVDVKPSEKAPFTSQPPADRMRRMATPLVKALQERRFGEDTFVKLFLPIEIFDLLSGTLHRTDPVAILYWSREELGQLLATRLQAATYGAITDFAQLVEADVHPRFSEWLLTVANSSPRHLLHAIEQILRVHVSQSDPGEATGKISRNTLANLPPRHFHPY